MRLLDLFCGAGGAAMGYHQAGFGDIVGVDIDPQPNYPFTFIQANAFEFMDAMIDGQEDIAYDLIHTSPPCQAYSKSTADRSRHPDYIAETRNCLDIIERPYVIENVENAPLIGYVRLCGSMFGLQIQRHRLFELSWPAMSLACNHKAWEQNKPSRYEDRRLGPAPWTVTGHLGGVPSPHSLNARNRDHAADLMGMPRGWPSRAYTEAIPPVYTKFLGEQFLAQRDHPVTHPP